MADKLPFQITSGTPNDDSVVHASDADNSDLSRSHNERGISRLQGTAPNYSASKTYNVNDIVEENGIVYRNTTSIGTPEAFDRSKWRVVWQTENIVHIFEESDFPALISGAHPLEDGKQYHIEAAITLTSPLSVPIGGTIGISNDSKYQHTIETLASAGFMTGINNIVDITTFADSSGDLLITTSAVHNLTTSDLVNVHNDTPGIFYSQIKAIVLSTPSPTTFTIDGNFTSTDTGFIDQGALTVDIQNLLVFKSLPSLSATIFELPMTQAILSFCEIINCRFDNFSDPGEIITPGNLFFLNNTFLKPVSPLVIFKAVTANIYECTFEYNGISDNALTITGGDRIVHNTIANCTFDIAGTSAKALAIETNGSNPLSVDAVISVFNNVDLNTGNHTLFNMTGSNIDETDPRVTVNGNIRQKNSLSAITIEFPFSAGPLAVAVLVNTLTAVTSTSWVENFAERFSLDTGAVTGVFTYDGLETSQFLITYNTQLMPETNSQDIFAGMFKNGTEIPEGRFTIDDADTGANKGISVTHSFVTELETGDTLQFGVGNVNTAEDVSIENQASVTVTRLT